MKEQGMVCKESKKGKEKQVGQEIKRQDRKRNNRQRQQRTGKKNKIKGRTGKKS